MIHAATWRAHTGRQLIQSDKVTAAGDATTSVSYIFGFATLPLDPETARPEKCTHKPAKAPELLRWHKPWRP